jgi:H+/Cl- antiporter ClcA
MLIFTAQTPQTQNLFCVCGVFFALFAPLLFGLLVFTPYQKTNRYKYRSKQQFFIFLGKNSTPNNK